MEDEVRSQVRSEIGSFAPSLAPTDLMAARGVAAGEDTKKKRGGKARGAAGAGDAGDDDASVAAREDVLREGGDIEREFREKAKKEKARALSTKAEPWLPENGEDGAGGEYDEYAEDGEGEEGEEEEDQEEDEGGEPPEHACSYCGISNPSCVVRCVKTNKWFCNGRGGSSGSHALQHCIRSRFREVALHPESPLGDSILECYNCGCRNVFLLGFIPSKEQTGVVVLLCREPCLTLEALKEQGWDLTLWQPIVEDKAFLPWLVHVPSKEEEEKARPVTVTQIAAIESLWRKRPNATWQDFLALAAKGVTSFDDLPPEGSEGAAGTGNGGEAQPSVPAANPVLLRYADGYHYQRCYAPLVKLEADESKLMTEALGQDGVSLRWETANISGSSSAAGAGASPAGSSQKRVFAHFRFNNRPDSDLNKLLLAGDEMKVKLPSLATQLGLTEALAKAEAKAKAARAAAAAASGEVEEDAGGEEEKDGDGDGDEDCAWWGVGAVKTITDGEICIELTSHSGETTAEAKAAAGQALKEAVQAAVTMKGGKGGKGAAPVTAAGSSGTSFLAGIPFQTTSGFTVELVWKGITFDRMQQALKTFAVDDRSVSAYLYHALLGHPVEPTTLPVSLPAEIRAPGLPALNTSQETAVRTVLQRPLSLIQGPPGTGKTVTSATIVYYLAQQAKLNAAAAAGAGGRAGAGAKGRHHGKDDPKGGSTAESAGTQVLVAAPSNVAVDHLTEKIAATGLKVVRVAARMRESVSSSIEHLTLHSMTAALGAAANPELKKLMAAKEAKGLLSPADETKLRRLTRAAESEILSAADVITTTCAGAGDRRLEGMRFKHVLVDEATQACEPESLIPVAKGAKQVVLVGDHCQLGPVIMSKAAAAAGLSQSLFERLIMLGVRPIRLQVQYRMHPALSQFPSNVFYEGSLLNGVSYAERACAYRIPWPVPSKPMFFFSVTSPEEISASGTSFLNRGEASVVERLVTSFLNAGVTPAQIGVITPYEGQRAYTTAFMVQHGALRSALYQGIEVASVDSFQGREKDYIVLSCVRSNEHQGIGFLNDPRRLNVALTRARFGLIVVGNPRVLAKQPLWHLLLSHFQDNSCLVDGNIGAEGGLKEVKITLPPPRKAYVPRTDHRIVRAMAMHAQEDAEQAAMQAYSSGAVHAYYQASFPLPGQGPNYSSSGGAGVGAEGGGGAGGGQGMPGFPPASVPGFSYHPGMLSALGPIAAHLQDLARESHHHHHHGHGHGHHHGGGGGGRGGGGKGGGGGGGGGSGGDRGSVYSQATSGTNPSGPLNMAPSQSHHHQHHHHSSSSASSGDRGSGSGGGGSGNAGGAGVAAPPSIMPPFGMFGMGLSDLAFGLAAAGVGGSGSGSAGADHGGSSKR